MGLNMDNARKIKKMELSGCPKISKSEWI